MSRIEVTELTKTYRLEEVRVEALRGVTLTVDPGEFVALVGKSGSGKSTLMNILGCLDRPTSGSYRLGGSEISAMSREQWARIRNEQIGFVFQNFNLLGRTSAVENVELPLLYRSGLAARRRRQMAIESLQRVGLGDRLSHHPGQLSGGQQQRVALARALVNEPSIVMGDEPTGNLDSRTSEEMIALFAELNRRDGITVLLVTHDPEVARTAGRQIVLRDGEVICDTEDADEAFHTLRA
jgi:ABC-type lipoprotein export system ATPase subunit